MAAVVQKNFISPGGLDPWRKTGHSSRPGEPMSDTGPNLERLHKARELNDLEELEAACRALLADETDDATAHQVRYLLGLCVLWRKENLGEAIDLFSEVAKHPSKDAIAKSARTSLAICLWHNAQKAKAIFELRKMVPTGVAPSLHTATALDFLYLFLKDSQADPKSIQQTQALRLTHIGHLYKESTDEQTKAHWALRLAVALSEIGDGPSKKRAKSLCEEIQNNKSQIDQTTFDNAQALLRSL